MLFQSFVYKYYACKDITLKVNIFVLFCYNRLYFPLLCNAIAQSSSNTTLLAVPCWCCLLLPPGALFSKPCAVGTHICMCSQIGLSASIEGHRKSLIVRLYSSTEGLDTGRQKWPRRALSRKACNVCMLIRLSIRNYHCAAGCIVLRDWALTSTGWSVPLHAFFPAIQHRGSIALLLLLLCTDPCGNLITWRFLLVTCVFFRPSTATGGVSSCVYQMSCLVPWAWLHHPMRLQLVFINAQKRRSNCPKCPQLTFSNGSRDVCILAGYRTNTCNMESCYPMVIGSTLSLKNSFTLPGGVVVTIKACSTVSSTS